MQCCPTRYVEYDGCCRQPHPTALAGSTRYPKLPSSYICVEPGRDPRTLIFRYQQYDLLSKPTLGLFVLYSTVYELRMSRVSPCKGIGR